jgi:hypothetical protein
MREAFDYLKICMLRGKMCETLPSSYLIQLGLCVYVVGYCYCSSDRHREDETVCPCDMFMCVLYDSMCMNSNDFPQQHEPVETEVWSKLYINIGPVPRSEHSLCSL